MRLFNQVNYAAQHTGTTMRQGISALYRRMPLGTIALTLTLCLFTGLITSPAALSTLLLYCAAPPLVIAAIAFAGLFMCNLCRTYTPDIPVNKKKITQEFQDAATHNTYAQVRNFMQPPEHKLDHTSGDEEVTQSFPTIRTPIPRRIPPGESLPPNLFNQDLTLGPMPPSLLRYKENTLTP